MTTLIQQISAKATRLRVPLSVHLDLTWRCNEDCVHCYLDHEGGGELSTAEVNDVLDQLAAAGTFFLCLSGGEILLRRDLMDIVAHARSLLFHVTLKTNGILLDRTYSESFARLGVSAVHISLYSHRAGVHDAITRIPGSFSRSVEAIRTLITHGVKTRVSNVLMRENVDDYGALQSFATDLGAEAKVDVTVSPTFDGDFSLSALRIPLEDLRRVYRDPAIVHDVEKFCAPPAPADDQVLEDHPCGAGHSGCYISPTGDVMPCIQFPVACGNLRRDRFADIWSSSPELDRIRALRTRDFPVCRTCRTVAACTRCPGLAMMEGDVLGPSLLDCEKAFARTGIPSPRLSVQ
jgi:radical SAM protein with 4Fe4S-binding SPASM domain